MKLWEVHRTSYHHHSTRVLRKTNLETYDASWVEIENEFYHELKRLQALDNNIDDWKASLGGLKHMHRSHRLKTGEISAIAATSGSHYEIPRILVESIRQGEILCTT